MKKWNSPLTAFPRFVLSAVFAGVLHFATSAAAQVILVPTGTVEGTVGLSGEVFGWGYANHYTGQTTLNGTVNPAEGTYSVPVSADKTFTFNVGINNFADTNAAQLTLNVYNQPAITEGSATTLDLYRDSGQIVGNVSVNAGATIESMTMRTYATDSSVPVNYSGYVTSYSTSPATALQPFPAILNARAYATVVVRLASGCTKSVNTPYKYFSVAKDATTTVNWDEIDMEGVTCPTGDVEGTFELLSLDDLQAQLNYTQIYLNGPASVNSRATPGFQFSGIPTGTYYSYSYNYFLAPYQYTYRYVPSAVTVLEGETTVYDTDLEVGAVHIGIETTGTWDLSDTYSASSYMNFNNVADNSSGQAWDSALNNDAFDFVVPEGQASAIYQWFYFYSNTDGRYRYQYVRPQFFNSAALQATITAGQVSEIGPVALNTSEAPVIFQVRPEPGQPGPILNRILINGFGNVRGESGETLIRPYIYADAQNNTVQSRSQTIAVDIRGLAGDYDLLATAYDVEGRAYTASFTLTLGNPENTPPGDDVSQILEDVNGDSIASITFDHVTGGGTTTISQVGTGPEAPANFAIFKSMGVNGNTGQFYYDIVTTATFEGRVLVCLHYDDSTMSAGQEAALELGHYNAATGQWEVLEQPDGSPDTVNDIICGYTDSFSLFAGLVPNDSDADGVFDVSDNCPDVANPDQLDTDGDGIGNACETDTDGDGIDDDTDLCPLTPSANNADQDGDGIGDVCDEDLDGDSTPNSEDNCPDVFNPDQFDYDYDGLGDACDPDADNDGVTVADDLCPLTPLGAAVEENGCSSTQLLALACPDDGNYKNHGEYVSCVAQEAELQVHSGLITEEEKGAIVSKAARSDIGKKK